MIKRIEKYYLTSHECPKCEGALLRVESAEEGELIRLECSMVNCDYIKIKGD